MHHASAIFCICSVDCPAGNYITADMTGCMMCNVGFYQPDTSQSSCLPCPPGFSTRVLGATSIDQCKRKQRMRNNCSVTILSHLFKSLKFTDSCRIAVICGPGEYAVDVNGAMRCVDCPRGSYQPGTFADMCIQCPDGFDTRQAGTIPLEDCECKSTVLHVHCRHT